MKTIYIVTASTVVPLDSGAAHARQAGRLSLRLLRLHGPRLLTRFASQFERNNRHILGLCPIYFGNIFQMITVRTPALLIALLKDQKCP